MALYDNKHWLLSHIRNSFVSSDETGMCEIVMAGEDLSHVKDQLDKFVDGDTSDESDDCLSVESGDVSFSIDYGMRARTNTAARIEKIEQAKQRAAKMKLIKWDSKKASSNENSNLDDMFQKVDPKDKLQTVKKSLLSLKLKESTDLPKNLYTMYAKCDGTGLINTPTRKYKIFLALTEKQNKNLAVEICCISSAKVVDLVGLILYHVRNKYPDLTLHPPSHYGLYITEEDGEIYSDLPPLDFREFISKYGFSHLGLVEHKEPVVTFEDNIKQTQEELDKLNKKKMLKDPLKLNEMKRTTADLEVMAEHKMAMEAPLYQSYQVNIITKMRSRTEVHLGISGDKIEIDPIQPQSSKFSLTKQKPVSYHIDSIAWCEIAESKGGKATFRLFYTSNQGPPKKETREKNVGLSVLQASASFKHLDFEADEKVAEEIVLKINLILDLRSSHSHKEYLASKERKQFKRKSFNIMK